MLHFHFHPLTLSSSGCFCVIAVRPAVVLRKAHLVERKLGGVCGRRPEVWHFQPGEVKSGPVYTTYLINARAPVSFPRLSLSLSLICVRACVCVAPTFVVLIFFQGSKFVSAAATTNHFGLADFYVAYLLLDFWLTPACLVQIHPDDYPRYRSFLTFTFADLASTPTPPPGLNVLRTVKLRMDGTFRALSGVNNLASGSSKKVEWCDVEMHVMLVVVASVHQPSVSVVYNFQTVSEAIASDGAKSSAEAAVELIALARGLHISKSRPMQEPEACPEAQPEQKKVCSWKAAEYSHELHAQSDEFLMRQLQFFLGPPQAFLQSSGFPAPTVPPQLQAGTPTNIPAAASSAAVAEPASTTLDFNSPEFSPLEDFFDSTDPLVIDALILSDMDDETSRF